MGMDSLLHVTKNGRVASQDATLYLVSDIGASNIRLALTGIDTKGDIFFHFLAHISSYELEASKIPFTQVVQRFLEKAEDAAHPISQIASGVFALAGPVIDHQQGNLTNRKIIIDLNSIENYLSSISLPVPLSLCNDFQAIGEALPYVDLTDPSQVTHLHGLRRDQKTSSLLAALGAGTGLGSVQTRRGWDAQWIVTANEGGHVFAPIMPGTIESVVYRIIQKNIGKEGCFLENEDLVSARGIVNLFRAYQDIMFGSNLDLFKYTPISQLRKVYSLRSTLRINYQNNKEEYYKMFAEMEETTRGSGNESIAAIIGDHQGKGILLVEEVLVHFFWMYGCAARNTIISQGNPDVLFIAGGIAPHYLPHINDFMQAFIDGFNTRSPSNQLEQIVQRTPTEMIVDPNIGLRGCTYAAQRLALGNYTNP